jgi:RND family efflux transporter MFP subunit
MTSLTRITALIFAFLVTNGSLLSAKDFDPLFLSKMKIAAGELLENGDATQQDYPVQATVINPYRSANVASEVSGIVEKINYEEGEFIEKGSIVAEISRTRYTLLMEKALEAVRGLELDLQRAKQEEKIKNELLTRDACTRQELLKSQADREIVETKLKEARKDLELAKLNLDSAILRAPYSGFMAFRFKQPHESVERLEKIFLIMDSARVYAVANVADNLLAQIKIGSEAQFQDSRGRVFRGTIDKIAKQIDPKSRTKKVYLLIDNSRGELEVGMTGSLLISR